MAAAFIYDNMTSQAWTVHGPPSSTEAEIQAILAVTKHNQHAHTIQIFSDSQAAINAITRATQQRYKNMHNLPNRVSLRKLLTFCQKYIITQEVSPKILPSPSIQLIHIYSHGDTNEKKKRLNEKKFGYKAKHHMKMNQIADDLAKSACTIPNEGHHPLNPTNDDFQIYDTTNPLSSCRRRIENLGKTSETNRFNATMFTKANRWLHKDNDLIATVHPLTHGHKTLATFCTRLLTATLPTKPTVRRSNWYKKLPEDHHKKKVYKDDNCPTCNIRESHAHIFDECPNRLPFRKKFVDTLIATCKKEANLNLNNILLWFTLAPFPSNNDRGWRGFIPNQLYNHMIEVTTQKKADHLCKVIALSFAANNYDIWKNRCNLINPKA